MRSTWTGRGSKAGSLLSPLRSTCGVPPQFSSCGTRASKVACSRDPKKPSLRSTANLPLSDVATLAQMVDDFTLNRRLVAQLSHVFRNTRRLLASSAFTVSCPTASRGGPTNLASRMAVGAGRGMFYGVVLREALWLAVAGVGNRTRASCRLQPTGESLLFGVKPNNPLVRVCRWPL